MKQRVISGAILFTIAFACIMISDITRVLLFAVAGVLCCYELSRNMEKADVYCAAWVMYVYIAAQAVLAIMHAGAVRYYLCFTCGVYLALFSGIVHRKVSGKGAVYTVFGLAYPGLIFGVLMMISVSTLWEETLMLGAFATWVCDSFALFGGLRFGRHKVAPNVSPNKSVEGCVIGAVFSMLPGLIIWLLPIFPNLSLPVCLLTCLVSSTLGQLGDLAESLIKRMIGVKDFSDLIPGHGGMFDRVDSLLFSIPTAYLCLHLAGLGV